MAVGPVRCELLSLLTGNLTGNLPIPMLPKKGWTAGNSNQFRRLAMI
jgi:hypothetical protein